MNTAQIQTALKTKGYDPGDIDGIRGRRTIAAIKAFQAANGLLVDGIAGPNTLAKLFPAGAPAAKGPVVPVAHSWMGEAVRLIGVTEDMSDADNPLIIGWARNLDIDYNDDAIPWCGLFVAHCIGSQLTDEPLPNYPLSARAWRTLGKECSPQLSAVMVFWRGSPSGALGHVGFYAGEDADAYHILGGNQSNAVTVARMAKSRFLESRWPRTALPPDGIVRKLHSDGRLSSNEE